MSSCYQRRILGVAFWGVLVILFWKGLPFFHEPRLWAEEGVVYLKAALERGWKSVFMPQLGYYAVIPSLATYLATFIPLVYIPAFTQGVSLLFWIILFLLIININDNEYSLWTKVLFLFSILFILLSQTEIFLNTINLQFITPIILMVSLLYNDKKLTRYQVIGLRLLQTICLLNGVLGILLMPYLLYKAFWVDRRYTLFAIYLVTIGIHIGMIMQYKGESNLIWRLQGNFEFLLKDYNTSLLTILENRKVYLLLFMILPVSLVCSGKFPPPYL